MFLSVVWIYVFNLSFVFSIPDSPKKSDPEHSVYQKEFHE